MNQSALSGRQPIDSRCIGVAQQPHRKAHSGGAIGSCAVGSNSSVAEIHRRAASKRGIGINGYSFDFLHNGEASVTRSFCERMPIGRERSDLVGTHAWLPPFAAEIRGRWAWARNTIIREYLTISARCIDLGRSSCSSRNAREPCDKESIRVRRLVNLIGGSIIDRGAAVPGDAAPPTRILAP